MANYSQDENFSNRAHQVMDQPSLSQYQRQQNQPGMYMQNPNGGGGDRDRQMYGYLNQLNQINTYNQDLLYQQQNQMDMQNQQMNQMMYEHDDMRRQMAMQRQKQQHQVRQQAPKPSSRQKELDALNLLNNFQKSLNGGSSLADLMGGSDPLADISAERSGNRKLETPSKSRFEKPNLSQAHLQPQPQPQQNFNDYAAYQQNPPSAFQNAAQMMINPSSPGYPPAYPQGYHPGMPYENMYQQPFQGMYPYGGYPMMMPQPEQKKESKTAEILMASLEKQNQILASLTNNINLEKDYKSLQDAKEIEHKIKQLELESQAKQYQLFTQDHNDTFGKNYNRKLYDPNVQKHNDFAPGMMPNMMSPLQLMQLQGMINGPNKFIPPGALQNFGVLPNEFMQ